MGVVFGPLDDGAEHGVGHGGLEQLDDFARGGLVVGGQSGGFAEAREAQAERGHLAIHGRGELHGAQAHGAAKGGHARLSEPSRAACRDRGWTGSCLRAGAIWRRRGPRPRRAFLMVVSPSRSRLWSITVRVAASFEIEAMARGLSGRRANSSCPVSRSMTSAPMDCTLGWLPFIATTCFSEWWCLGGLLAFADFLPLFLLLLSFLPLALADFLPDSWRFLACGLWPRWLAGARPTARARAARRGGKREEERASASDGGEKLRHQRRHSSCITRQVVSR
jgi:hypothetical protein